jgi:DNA-binding LacI/PurR family transcriptional regulator
VTRKDWEQIAWAIRLTGSIIADRVIVKGLTTGFSFFHKIAKRLTISFKVKKMTSLHDVAKKAGVSTATVSKVLSNTPYFTEETRRKVLEAVDALGYVPNLAARALSSGKTHIIAVVFPYVYEAIFTDPNILHTLQGIEAECTSQGYNILLSTPHLGKKGLDAHYQQLVHSGYLDGVIAVGHPLDRVLEPVYAKGIPAVAMGYCSCKSYVRGGEESGGYQLMEHVLALGHRRIGIISLPVENHSVVPHRLAGMRTAAEAADLQFKKLPFAYGDWSTASGAQGAEQLLSDYPNLTALICLNDRMAMGAIQQARSMGRNIPDNLTIVGYDDIPTAAHFAPPLTTVNQRAPEQGQIAAQILFNVLNGKDSDSVELPLQLIVRESSAAPM